MSKLTTLAEAIRAHVHDGDLIYAAGFTHLIPFAAGHEMGLAVGFNHPRVESRRVDGDDGDGVARGDVVEVRERLAAAGKVGGVDLSPIGTQNGLFSIIPFTPDQVQSMREKHGVYFAASGRINVAGLTSANIDRFIAAVADVTG